jgi:hypothetical protein
LDALQATQEEKEEKAMKYYRITQQGQEVRDVWRTTIIGVPDDEEITEEMLDEDKLDDFFAEHQHSVEQDEDCDYSFDQGTEIVQLPKPEGEDAERKLTMSSTLILAREDFDEELGVKEEVS